MKLVIAEKPFVALALAKVPDANGRFEGYLRRDAFALRTARASEAERSTMQTSCSWQRPTVERSLGWNLMMTMMPDDTKTGRRRNGIYKR
jgi:hypothetical protein